MSKRRQIQRLHLFVFAMCCFRHVSLCRRARGSRIRGRRSAGIEPWGAGLRAHCTEHDVAEVIAIEPMSWDGKAMRERLGGTMIRNNQFLCHYDDFSEWAGSRKSLEMGEFYRWQGSRLGVLMGGEQPVGGRWNFDHDNREPPPRDGRARPPLTRFPQDEIDE